MGERAFFTNNLIDNQGSGTYSSSGPWDHTLFYGSGNRTSSNTNPVVGDPKFASPNGGGNGLSSAASADIYCWKNGGSAASYCDDFSAS